MATSLPKRVALLDQVHELLKERVLDRSYRAGDKLNLDALARELSVSTTPIRESMARLVAEGLVRAQPYVGFFVADMPSQEYFEQLYDLREVLEPWAAHETARRQPPDCLAVLQGSLEAMKQGTLSKKYARFRGFSGADEAFHAAIVAGTGNAPAMKAYEDLHIHLHLSRLYIDRDQDSDEVRQQHAGIVEAIVAGQPKDAATRMKNHLRRSRCKLLG